MIEAGTIQKMKQAAQQQTAVLSKPFKTEILNRKRMSGDNRYCFCPYCLKEGTVNQNNKDHALFVVTEKEIYRGVEGKCYQNFETYWHCNHCGRNLQTADFEKFYVKPYTQDEM